MNHLAFDQLVRHRFWRPSDIFFFFQLVFIKRQPDRFYRDCFRFISSFSVTFLSCVKMSFIALNWLFSPDWLLGPDWLASSAFLRLGIEKISSLGSPSLLVWIPHTLLPHRFLLYIHLIEREKGREKVRMDLASFVLLSPNVALVMVRTGKSEGTRPSVGCWMAPNKWCAKTSSFIFTRSCQYIDRLTIYPFYYCVTSSNGAQQLGTY